MLVLSRKTGERIVIGNDIVITVTQLRGDRVRIGIDAPEHIQILRGELDEAASQFADAPSSMPAQ